MAEEPKENKLEPLPGRGIGMPTSPLMQKPIERPVAQDRPALKQSPIFVEEPVKKSKWHLILILVFIFGGGAVVGWWVVDTFFAAPSLSKTSLTVVSVPGGAEVYVNNQLRGVTPLAVPAISPGEYHLKLTKEGYADWESGLVRILPNEPKLLRAELSQKAEEGVAAIKEEIARILEENAIEKEPSFSKEESLSRYTTPEELIIPPVEAVKEPKSESEPALTPVLPEKKSTKPVILPKEEKKPAKEITQPVAPVKTEGKPETSKSKASSSPIEPLSEPKLEPAKIKFDSEPTGAKVYLKDEYQGNTPLTIAGKLGWQQYVFKISYPGYSDWKSSIFVGPGQEYQLKVELKKKEGGSLNISSSPLNVEIYLDGRMVGETPIEDLAISVGEHTLKGTREGYLPYEMKIVLEKGETRYINFVLKKK